MRHLLLPTFVIAALAAGAARAQGPNPPYGEFPRVHPGQTELPPGHPPVDNAPVARPLRDYRTRGRPLGCWASFNGYTCSSLPSTWTFVFGSCRDFYGEPCLKGPPPSPLPDWAAGDGGRVPPRPDAKAVRQRAAAERPSVWRRLFAMPGSVGCTNCAQP
ncbi:MAG: hypothetical protein ACRC33_06225 [Gemmataceae bacterium]